MSNITRAVALMPRHTCPLSVNFQWEIMKFPYIFPVNSFANIELPSANGVSVLISHPCMPQDTEEQLLHVHQHLYPPKITLYGCVSSRVRVKEIRFSFSQIFLSILLKSTSLL